jgi:hypothetical protein
MTTRRIVVLAAVIVCLAGFGFAQDEELPIRNWSAPPFWNPAVHPRAEGELSGQMAARVQDMQAQAESLPSSPLPFVAITPCRIVDTRVAISDGFHQPNFIDGEARSFPFPTSPDCPGLPATAGAWSVNIQFRPMSQLSYLTAYPTGTTMPTVSTLTAGPSAWVGNAAIVPAGPAGAIDIYCQYAGRVVIDINGYYGPSSVVTSLNTKTGDLTLSAGSNVTITPSGQTLTIAATGGPGGELPAGSTSQTLRSNGSAWFASSALTNDGSNVGISGNLLLPSTTSSNGAVLLGGARFMHGFGNYNTFLGEAAGNTTMAGGFDTGVGYDALHSSTSGTLNTAVGANSLGANTVGGSNTAVGTGSLQNNTTANGNTAVGKDALRTMSYNNSGVAFDTYDTAVGFEAMFSNQPTNSGTGRDNTGIGAWALHANTTGYYNTAVGSVALYDNTVGYANTAVGKWSLANNIDGDGNTASGYQSATANTEGSYNTAYGYSSLHGNTTANQNTAIGYGALYTQSYSNGSTPYDANNTAVGYEALYLNQPTDINAGTWNSAFGHQALRGNTTGRLNVALGAQCLYANTTGYQNTAVGYSALRFQTSGHDNVAVGRSTGETITVGSYDTFVGVGADAAANSLTNATAIGSGAVVNASNHVRIGNTQVTQIGGQVAWSNLSDARAKTAIRDLDLGLDFVMQLRPVAFSLKTGDGRTDMGFVAQDVEVLLGDGYSVLGIGGDPDGMLSLRYTDLIAPLVKAIQEQQETIEAQEKEIAALKAQVAQISELRRQVQALMKAKEGMRSGETIGN